MYKVTETIIKTNENTEIITYGIKSKHYSFKDLSCDKNKVEQLCKLCNDKKLDECHISDVIEDFLVFIDIEF